MLKQLRSKMEILSIPKRNLNWKNLRQNLKKLTIQYLWWQKLNNNKLWYHNFSFFSIRCVPDFYSFGQDIWCSLPSTWKSPDSQTWKSSQTPPQSCRFPWKPPKTWRKKKDTYKLELCLITFFKPGVFWKRLYLNQVWDIFQKRMLYIYR